jgi:hypothetical protein
MLGIFQIAKRPFFFSLIKYLSILLIKNYKNKALTSQRIKFYKIIGTYYEIT